MSRFRRLSQTIWHRQYRIVWVRKEKIGKYVKYQKFKE
jgi:hypothetical protein